MKTKIVFAFPGLGKTKYHDDNPYTSLHSKVSDWKYVYTDDGEKLDNPDFPNLYIDYIKDQYESGRHEYILITPDNDVMRALLSEGIGFIVIRPDEFMYDNILGRLKESGSSDEYVQYIADEYSSILDMVDKFNPDNFNDINKDLVEFVSTDSDVTFVLEGGQDDGELLYRC